MDQGTSARGLPSAPLNVQEREWYRYFLMSVGGVLSVQHPQHAPSVSQQRPLPLFPAR